MAVSSAKCPLCCIAQPLVSTSSGNDGQTHVSCKRCGDFVFCAGAPDNWDIPPIPRFILDKGVKRADHDRGRTLFKTYLSIYTRECSESRRPARLPSPFNLTKLETLAETYAYTPVASKPAKLLRLLEKRTTFPGRQVRLDLELDYPAVHAVNAEELGFYLQALQKDGSLRYENTPVEGESNLATFATITLDGWQRLASSGANSRTAFVAMSFDPSLDSAFSDGIAPAVCDAGYDKRPRIDQVQHNDNISDRIIVEIRRSRFVIADVTLQSQNVYFEAGFAMALGLPVIWCCRKDDFKNIKFDTRQYNHIIWKDPADLRFQLRDRIVATIGPVR